MGVNRRIIALAVVVLSMAAYLFLFDLPAQEQADRRAAQELRLFHFDPARVDTFRVDRPQSSVVVVRDPVRGWQLVEPIEEAADSATVTGLLAALAEAERVRVVADSLRTEDWQDYDLAERRFGRVRIRVTSHDGQVAELFVGALTPNGTLCYVRRPGSDALELAERQVYRIASVVHHALRRTRLFDVEAQAVVELELRRGHEHWKAMRGEDGVWRLAGPRRRRLRRRPLDRMAYLVATERVDQFLRDALEPGEWAAYGLDPPWADLRWRSREGREGRLELGNEENQGRLYARRGGGPPLIVVSSAWGQILQDSLEERLDPNPIGVVFSRVPRLRLSDPQSGAFVEIHRDGDAVTLIAGRPGEPPHPVESSYLEQAVRNVVRGLEEFAADQEIFLAAGNTPVAVAGPAVVAVDFDDLEGRSRRLMVHRRSGGEGVWVRIDDEGALHHTADDLLFRLRSLLEGASSAEAINADH